MEGYVGGPVPIHSSEQTVFSLPYIERVTLGAGEEVDEVAGGASGMGADRLGRLVMASEGQAAGVCEARSLARVGRGNWGLRLVLTRS